MRMSCRRRGLLIAAAAVCLAAGGAAVEPAARQASRQMSEQTSPAAPRWRVGVARVLVTPQEPIFLKGYGSRTRPSEGIRADLFVKALAVQYADGPVAVLVTSDLHSYTQHMSQTIAEGVQKKYGLARERLVLNGSHTHSGPAVTAEPVFRPSEDINPEQQAVIRRYTARLMDQIVELVGRAVADLAPAHLAFGQGAAGFGVNRRRISAGMRHLPGPVDQDVPVLTARSADGALRAIVFGYACHATSAPPDYEIHGDWPGYAQAAIEKAHPGATAMFVNGCGADCDPGPRASSPDLPPLYGEIMGAAVAQVVRRTLTPVAGPLTAAFGYTDLPFQTPPSRAELEERLKTAAGMRARHTRQMLAILDREGRIPDTYPYPVQVWRFGSSLTFIALGGETVVDYSLRFKAAYGWENTWVAGYSNDVMGYIPSLRVLKEGGYEGGGAMINYGRPGPVAPETEEVIARKVDELVRRTGGGN